MRSAANFTCSFFKTLYNENAGMQTSPDSFRASFSVGFKEKALFRQQYFH